MLWASATESKAGANGMDLINDVKNIQLAKKECDFVFVIVHGGHEYYNLPSPRMQKQYRFYVDSGADIVVGHHTHCIIGMETYRGKPIYYSLGNFLFTKKSVYKEWYNGIVLQIELLKNKQISSKPIFIKQSIDSYKLSLIKNNELKEFKTKFNYNSLLIINEHKLFDSWNNFIMERYTQYKDYWSPLSFIKNKYLRYIFSKMGFMKISGKNGRMLFLNLLRCEAHSDLSKEVLQRELSKLDSNNNRKK